MRALGLLLCSTIACTAMNQPGPPPPQSDALAARLAAADLTEMAMSLGADPAVQALWRDTPEPAAYAALVEDAGQPAQVRFAAVLVLRSRDAAADPSATAEVLATGLAQNLAGYAHPWGRLWLDDDLGTLGAALVELGRPAIPALTALLDDASPRDTYVGSEEATELTMRRYRVKDFAAFYLARIVGAALAWEPDQARRDDAIDALRPSLR